jgi:hypothetical protein
VIKAEKWSRMLTVRLPQEKTVEIEILVDAGPLVVCPVWDWSKNRKVAGLYFIYMKNFGLHLGPFYANLATARDHAHKLMREFPQKSFWEQPLEWFQRQTGFHDWVDKNLGKPQELIGGQWESEEKSEGKK